MLGKDETVTPLPPTPSPASEVPAPAVKGRPGLTLPDLFAERVARDPEGPAATYGSTSLTYGALDRETDAVAAQLRALGARPGRIVAILADRSLGVVVAMLAIVKVGAAYLALDPSHPPVRLRAIREEARPIAVIVDPAAGTPLAAGAEAAGWGLPLVAVSGGSRAHDQFGCHEPAVHASIGPDDLAYVVYTSGSTGAPKGVCITHGNVVARTWQPDYLSVEPGDRVAQMSNAAFDILTVEVWGALLNGGELVGLDRGTVLSPGRLAEALRTARIRTAVVATPIFNQIAGDDPGAFATLSQLLVGGDVMAVAPAARVAANSRCVLLNGYGPAECTALSTVHRVRPEMDDLERVPIGTPVGGVVCHVLDESLRPVQPGGVGQLYIGGDGVGRGYLEQPESTASAFLPDPVGGSGGFVYATGDLVVELPDGALDFRGRADHQVKIRGVRVELEEIDAWLVRHPGVRESSTIAPADEMTGDRALISYYVPEADALVESSTLASFLRERLPEHMVPNRWIALPALPRNSNAKVDRARLAPSPSPGRPTSIPGTGNRTLPEEVAAMMGELLEGPEPGPDEDFFEAGGQSMLATRLLTRINRRFGVAITLPLFFEDPTARALALHVEVGRHGSS